MSTSFDWDLYWQSTGETAAYSGSEYLDAALRRFWQQIFQQYLSGRVTRLLDVACGSGVVARLALEAEPRTWVCGTDWSLPALIKLRREVPRAAAVAADAKQLPFHGAAFDTVVSQFGMEYGGFEAIVEAARLLAPGGRMVALLHIKDGGFYRQSGNNLAALERVRGTGAVELGKAAFAAAYALGGDANATKVAAFKTAERAFTPAVRALEDILRDFGSDIAGGFVQRLYNDIAHMYRNMSAFELSDIMAWFDGLEPEIAAYSGRMSAQRQVALDATEITALSGRLRELGFAVAECRALDTGNDSPALGWVMILQQQ